MRANYIDEKGNYINSENLSLKQIFDKGYEEGYHDALVGGENPETNWKEAVFESRTKNTSCIIRGFECSNCHMFSYKKTKYCCECGRKMEKKP